MNDSPSDGRPPSDDVIFTRYASRLARLAQQHLSSRLSSKIDGEDITQSAFRTFFRRRDASQFAIDSETELWQLLAHITIRKAQAHGRRLTAAKRDVKNEEGLADGGHVAATPRPEDTVIVEDEIERILNELPEQYASILGLLLEGRSKTEVAETLGLSRMTIHRAIGVLRNRLDQSTD